MSEIVVEGVTKRFGGMAAVDGVSLRAEKGRFVVLLGPSGCGKSTLLRLIAGLEEVTEGKVFIEGRDVTALDPTRRRREAAGHDVEQRGLAGAVRADDAEPLAVVE